MENLTYLRKNKAEDYSQVLAAMFKLQTNKWKKGPCLLAHNLGSRKEAFSSTEERGDRGAKSPGPGLPGS